MTPAPCRVGRRRALGTIARILVASFLMVIIGAGVARALWSATSAPGGGGAAGVASVNQGVTPSAAAVKQSVTVTWAASTLSNRTTPAAGYYIKRYDFNTNISQTVLAGCAGKIVATACTELNVPDGRWVYSVTPAYATNWRGAESLKSNAVTSDGTAPANNLSISVVSGKAYKSSNTIYYRGTVAGSLTLTNAVTDAGTGPASSSTATLTNTPTGWSHTPSTVSTPAGGPYVSNTFNWGALTTSAPNEAVTSRDVATNINTATTLSFVNDSTAPTGGTVTYTNGNVTGRSVSVTLGTATDGGSGILTRQLQRASSPLADCISFSGFTDVGTDAPSSPYVDSSVSNGVCYKYRYVVTDQVGNQSIVNGATIGKVDYSSAVTASAGLVSYWRLGETGVPVASDTFTGTNGTLLTSRDADLGGAWTYLSGTNNEQIINGRITSTNSGRALYHSGVTPSSADYSVEAELYVRSLVNGDKSGVVGRLTATTPTFYMARYEVGSGTGNWRLVKYSGTTPTNLGLPVARTLTAGQSYRLRLEITGTNPTTLRLFVDGILTVSVTDSTTPLTVVGLAGFMEGENGSAITKSTTTGIHLDNFKVTNLRATDSKGTNHAAFVNGAAVGMNGAMAGDTNTAAQFDGVDDYVQALGTASIPVGSSARTVEMWFRTTSGARQVLFSYGTLTASREFGLWLNAGGASMTAWGFGTGNDKVFTLSAAVNDGLWHQVVETYSGTTLTLYIDGLALPTQAATRATTMDALYGFGIGAVLVQGDSGSGGYFNGLLDEVSVYNTAISQSMVTDHYQLGHAPPDPPPAVTTTVANLAYTENGTSFLDSGITVSDSVSSNLTGATVTMTTNYASGEDTLAFTTQNGIIGTWTAATGVLALTGTATVSDYQDALRSVTYTNSSDAPTTGNRTVTFVASDGAPSNTATRQIAVSAVNDGPTEVVPSDLTMVMNTSTSFSAANGNVISISDSDAAAAIVQVQLISTNGAATLSGVTGLSFAIGDGTADATMTFSGTITSINNALAGASFSPGAGFKGSAGLQIVTNDQGNTGSGGSLSDNETVAIAVVSIPPVVGATASNAAYMENDGPLPIDPAIAVVDTDSADLTGATVTVTVNYASTQDTLEFTAQNGITGSWTAATGVLALSGIATSSDYQDALRSVTYSNSSDAPATTNRTVTFAVNDDSVSNTASRQITVTAVNDPPTGGSNTRTTNEDVSYTVATSDFGFADPIDAGAHSFLAVTIATLPSVGSLKLNGTAVTAGQVVTAANIASNLLIFTPGANGSGTPYASFTFQVQDNGGIANGGIDLDPSPATLTVNVTAVNDAPAGSSTTKIVAEDTPYVITAGDFGFSDANDVPPNAFTQVKISTLPALGSLKLNGVAVTVGQVVTVANIASNLLVFTPFANANGAAYASFTFQVQDNGGIANGGVNLDVSPATLGFDLTAVNDAPVNSVPLVTQVTTKNSAKVFSGVTGNLILISDIDAASGSVQVQLISTNATTTLSTISGLTFAVGDGSADATMTFSGSISAINAALAGVSVAPAPGFAGLANVHMITNDLGNTGVGGALTDDSSVAIAVLTYAETITGTSGLKNYWRLGEATMAIDSFTAVAGATLQTLPAWTKHSMSTADAVVTAAGRIRKSGATLAYQGGLYYSTAVPESLDYSVSADVYVASIVSNDLIGVTGRTDPTAITFYGAVYDRAAQQWILYSVVNGVESSRGVSSVQSLTALATYRLTLDMNGSTIRLLVDGVPRVSVVNTAVTSAGLGGMIVGFGTAGTTLTDGTGMQLDNFSVDPPAMVDNLSVNQGEYSGGVTLGVTGTSATEADTAVQFDGVNDYATAARQIGDDFSIEFWFKSTQGIGTGTQWTSGAGLVDADVAGTASDFGVSLRSDGRVVAGVGGTSNRSIVSTSGGFNNGVWHHVVFTRTRATAALLLYIDGVPAAPQVLGTTTTSLTSSANISFGRIQSGTNYYSGALDEVAVYTVVLPPATVIAHFNAGV